MKGIIPTICDLLCYFHLSLSIFLRFIDTVEFMSTSFLCRGERISHNWFIHSPVNGPLGCSHLLATGNSAVTNMCIHAFVLSTCSQWGKDLGAELLDKW